MQICITASLLWENKPVWVSRYLLTEALKETMLNIRKHKDEVACRLKKIYCSLPHT